MHSVNIRVHILCFNSVGQCFELVRGEAKYFKSTSSFTSSVSGRIYWRAVSTGNSRLRRVSALPSVWLATDSGTSVYISSAGKYEALV